MKRQIVKIDKVLCDGCGLCIPNCAEGALQIIDGKARLVSDLFCDGLGACLGHCPQGAITIEEREAVPYDEYKVMDSIVQGGPNVIKAHMEHMREHGEFEYLATAKRYLIDKGIEIELDEVVEKESTCSTGACPGSQTIDMRDSVSAVENESGKRSSHLTQWPIQFHLVSPEANYYRDSDLLLAADCAGFACPDLHKNFMKGKSIAIACPKLDTNKQVYLEKLIAMIEHANLKSITVLIMTVPCCGGLLQLAQQAIEHTGSDIPLKVIVVGVDGEVVKEAVI